MSDKPEQTTDEQREKKLKEIEEQLNKIDDEGLDILLKEIKEMLEDKPKE